MFWSRDVCLCLFAFCCEEKSILAFCFWTMMLQLMKRSQNPIDAKKMALMSHENLGSQSKE
jgi:hypothetical protein